jgi:hypothetical protein
MAKLSPEQQIQVDLKKALNELHVAKKKHGPDSKEAKAADALVHKLTRKLPKPKGSGPTWR